MHQQHEAAAGIAPTTLPGGLEDWLIEFIGRATHDTAVLRENGAIGQATARDALLRQLLDAASTHLSEEIGVAEVADLLGACEETARRKIRSGQIVDCRSNPRGHTRVRRGDVLQVARSKRQKYDVVADAQDVAKLRRTAA
jgi:hypothetical protein